MATEEYSASDFQPHLLWHSSLTQVRVGLETAATNQGDDTPPMSSWLNARLPHVGITLQQSSKEITLHLHLMEARRC